MIDYPAMEQASLNGKVCLCGIGSAGIKVVEEAQSILTGNAFVCAMDPDARSLNASSIPCKIHLGPKLTRGLGTGGDANVGRDAAIETETAILRVLEGVSLLVTVAGMGGGTGSGVMPEVVRLAKERGAYVVSVVINPFRFEGQRRKSVAEDAVSRLAMYSDMVLRFDNDSIDGLLGRDDGVLDAFSAANKLMARVSMLVPSLLEFNGNLLQVGIEDLLRVTGASRGICSFGMVETAGAEPVADVLTRLKKSPLFLENRLPDAAEVLVLAQGGASLTLKRLQELLQGVADMLGDKVTLHIGVGASEEEGDCVRLTVLSVMAAAVAETAPLPTVQPEQRVMLASRQLDSAEPQNERKAEQACQAFTPVTTPAVTAQVQTAVPVEVEPVAPIEPVEEPAVVSEPAQLEAASTTEPEDAPPSPPSVAEDSEPAEIEEDAEESASRMERGMFANVSPILVDGEDLDLPPALRKKKPEQE